MSPHSHFDVLTPQFPRLDEYMGVWAIYPSAADRLIDLMTGVDFRQFHAALPGNPPAPSQPTMYPAKGGKNVAVIGASGMLMKQRSSAGGTSTVQLRRDLQNAVRDPNVSAVLLAIDSPGGTVAGTQALANEIKAAGRKKPVWAQIDDIGASAAYWIASQASQIFASVPTTSAGNIGTYLVVRTRDNGDGKTSATARVFRSGALKGIGEDEITDEQAAHLQQHVDGINSHFLEAVAKGRGLGKTAMAELSDGRLLLAESALSARLIDGIRPMESTLTALANL